MRRTRTKKGARWGLAAALASLALAGGHAPAPALNPMPASHGAMTEGSTAVFAGTVARVEPSRREGARIVRVAFEDLRWGKGARRDEVVLTLPEVAGAREADFGPVLSSLFESGKRYVVFAQEAEKEGLDSIVGAYRILPGPPDDAPYVFTASGVPLLRPTLRGFPDPGEGITEEELLGEIAAAERAGEDAPAAPVPPRTR